MLALQNRKLDEQGCLDMSYLRKIFDLYDECALESAIRLSDALKEQGKTVHLEALTISSDPNEHLLKILLALKYDKVTYIADNHNNLNNATSISAVISSYLAEEGMPDLILTGKQSSEGNNGKLPFLLAERLDIPVLSDVFSINPEADNNLEVLSHVPGGTIRTMLHLPAILAVGETDFPKLRVPTIKDRMTYGKRDISVFTSDTLLLKGGKALETDRIQISLFTEEKERTGLKIDGSNHREAAHILYKDYWLKQVDMP